LFVLIIEFKSDCKLTSTSHCHKSQFSVRFHVIVLLGDQIISESLEETASHGFINSLIHHDANHTAPYIAHVLEKVFVVSHRLCLPKADLNLEKSHIYHHLYLI
jgi:hypothetical protein